MAEVLSPRTDSQDFYSSSPHSFYIHNHHHHHQQSDLDPSTSMLDLGAPAQSLHDDASLPKLRSHGSSPALSSRASASDLSNMLSMVTPPSSVASSLEDKYKQALDSEDDYPQFDTYDAQYSEQIEEHQDRETDTTASDISLPTPTVVDDTAMRQEPSHHVDYLSHNWKEEDVWSSWRHIVSQRRVYGQQSRLENAAWRTWVKNKYQLRTVSPETLNWLKESDVTWLYGPLKPAAKHPISQPESAPTSRISKNNSFTMHKKPILKKRSMSEVMLQKSISTSSLLKQAAASVQAQGRGYHSRLDRAGSDYISSCVISEAPSREGQSSADDTASSGNETPSECCGGREKKHIRFDNTVEQCIAVEIKPDEDEDESEDDEEHSNALSSSSSDEGLVMMRKKPLRPGLSTRSGSGRGSRSGSHQGRKTIETLPSTTLKYRTDSPEVSEEQQQAAMARSWSARPRLSPSASQETLRPSRPSRNFLLGAEEEIEEEDDIEDHSWSFGANNPRSSLGAAASSSEALPGLVRHDSSSLPRSRSREHMLQQPRPRHGTPRTSFDESLRDISVVSGSGSARQLPALQSEPGAYGMEGMRRTESGMFMPEDDEDDIIATGLFGRISETVNTARDIAHVIWNVGWRK